MLTGARQFAFLRNSCAVPSANVNDHHMDGEPSQPLSLANQHSPDLQREME